MKEHNSITLQKKTDRIIKTVFVQRIPKKGVL